MAKFSSEYEKMSKVEDETVRLGTLNSAVRAAQYWKSEAVDAVKAFNDALDAEFARLDRTTSSVESLKANVTLQIARMQWERTGKVLRDAFAASDLDELNAAEAALKDQLAVASNAMRQATTAVAALGEPTNDITTAADKLTKGFQRAAEIVGEGGGIRAAMLSATDGRAAATATLAVVGEYVDLIRKSMAEDIEENARQTSLAHTILISAVVISLLIGIGSAVWISLKVSRGLGRAVKLADAVAVGDLSQKIDATSDDEVGDLIKALNAVIVSLSATAQAAEAIGSGDLGVDIKRRSDKDAFGVALEKMCFSLRRSAEIAGAIASGDLSIEVHHRSEKDALGSAFERMVQNLRTTAKVADAIAAGDLSVAAKRLSDKDTLGIAFEKMVSSLSATAQVAEAIAAGDLSVQIRRLSDKDVLGIAFERMAQSLGATAKVAEAIAAGDLGVQIKRLSDKDVLGIAFERMAQSLGATAKAANAIAAGDLTVEAKRLSDKDTLGIALEKMLEKLRGVVREALAAAHNVASGSQELSTSAEQLSQGATEQASATEEASSSMEEMAANIKQTSDNAEPDGEDGAPIGARTQTRAARR